MKQAKITIKNSLVFYVVKILIPQEKNDISLNPTLSISLKPRI
jgi:hypothetical protein